MSRWPAYGPGRCSRRRVLTDFSYDAVVVGGCGHVGLPLALAFASRGLNVVVYDTNVEAVESVNAGVLPFDEPGGAEVLAAVVGRTLMATADPSTASLAEHVAVGVG